MRRRIVSNWNFQLSFAFAIIRGVIVGLLIPGLTVLFTLYLMTQHSDLVPEQKSILINGLNHLTTTLIAILALVSAIYGFVGLLLSQRFVGPMTRIETWSVQHLMRQEPGSLKVRSTDELSVVATSLNRVVHQQEQVEAV